MKKIFCIGGQDSFSPSVLDLLKCEGYDTQFFENADKALRYIEKNTVDLLICELKYISDDNLQFLRKVKTIYPGGYLPTILVASDQEKDLLINALYLCTGSFLPKPLDNNILLASIQSRLMEVKEQRSSAQSDRTKENYLSFFMLVQEIRETLGHIRSMADAIITPDNPEKYEGAAETARKIKDMSNHLINLISDITKMRMAG